MHVCDIVCHLIRAQRDDRQKLKEMEEDGMIKKEMRMGKIEGRGSGEMERYAVKCGLIRAPREES